MAGCWLRMRVCQMTDSDIKALIEKIKSTVFTNQDNVYYVLREALDEAESIGFNDGHDAGYSEGYFDAKEESND